MLRKSNLVYVAEDYKLDYDEFSDYCFKYHSDSVWRVFAGVEYCHAGSESYLVSEFLEFKKVNNAV